MSKNVRYRIYHRNIFTVLRKYIKSNDIEIIKSPYKNNEYIVTIKGEKSNKKAKEISAILIKSGYRLIPILGKKRNVVKQNKLSTKKMLFIPGRMACNNYFENSIYLKVAAPKPPVSPPHFPNPNGKPSQKKKG